ncbi:MAG: lysozyme [Sneathiella sp.]
MKDVSVLSLALPLIRKYEGLGDGDKALPGLQPYLCPAGVWTLGYGSTRDENGQRVTKHSDAIMLQQANVLLARDTRRALAAVRRQVRVPLTPEEAAALTSFTFNLGAGALASSTLLKRVNSNERADIPHQFRKWIYAGGRILPGLVRRRAEEAMLWERRMQPEPHPKI